MTQLRDLCSGASLTDIPVNHFQVYMVELKQKFTSQNVEVGEDLQRIYPKKHLIQASSVVQMLKYLWIFFCRSIFTNVTHWSIFKTSPAQFIMWRIATNLNIVSLLLSHMSNFKHLSSVASSSTWWIIFHSSHIRASP